MKAILETESGYTVVGEASDDRQILASLSRTAVDILTYEPRAAGRGLDLLPEIKRQHRKTAVLVYTADVSARFGVQAIHAGADGYVVKDASLDELLRALERLSRGERHIPDSIARQLATVVAGQESTPQLSPREQYIVTGICDGLSLKQIGAHLGVDARTVSTYRARVLKKLHVTTNAELIQLQG